MYYVKQMLVRALEGLKDVFHLNKGFQIKGARNLPIRALTCLCPGPHMVWPQALRCGHTVCQVLASIIWAEAEKHFSLNTCAFQTGSALGISQQSVLIYVHMYHKQHCLCVSSFLFDGCWSSVIRSTAASTQQPQWASSGCHFMSSQPFFSVSGLISDAMAFNASPSWHERILFWCVFIYLEWKQKRDTGSKIPLRVRFENKSK